MQTETRAVYISANTLLESSNSAGELYTREHLLTCSPNPFSQLPTFREIRLQARKTLFVNMSFCLTSGSDDKETFAGAKVQQIFDICKFIYKKGKILSKRYPGTPESRHPDANLAEHRHALNQKEKGMPEPHTSKGKQLKAKEKIQKNVHEFA